MFIVTKKRDIKGILKKTLANIHNIVTENVPLFWTILSSCTAHVIDFASFPSQHIRFPIWMSNFVCTVAAVPPFSVPFRCACLHGFTTTPSQSCVELLCGSLRTFGLWRVLVLKFTTSSSLKYWSDVINLVSDFWHDHRIRFYLDDSSMSRNSGRRTIILFLATISD